jgi:hypothetical protein
VKFIRFGAEYVALLRSLSSVQYYKKMRRLKISERERLKCFYLLMPLLVIMTIEFRRLRHFKFNGQFEFEGSLTSHLSSRLNLEMRNFEEHQQRHIPMQFSIYRLSHSLLVPVCLARQYHFRWRCASEIYFLRSRVALSLINQ